MEDGLLTLLLRRCHAPRALKPFDVTLDAAHTDFEGLCDPGLCFAFLPCRYDPLPQIHRIAAHAFLNPTSFLHFSSLFLTTAVDAFNDILRGGFGTPDEGFVVVWENSDQSRQVLGYQATLDLLRETWQRLSQGLTYDEIAARDYRFMKAVSPELEEAALQESVRQTRAGYRQLEHQLADAEQHIGATIFDWIVAAFQDHSDIELRLE
jgi:hypothetical protein